MQAALYWLARMIEGGEDPLYFLSHTHSNEIGSSHGDCW